MNTYESVHQIEATIAQCEYLNRLAENNMRYRNSLRDAQSSIESELNGRRQGVSHQTLAEINRYFGAVDALLSMKHNMFYVNPETLSGEDHTAHWDTVNGWVVKAMTHNDQGLMGTNWFTPAL